MSEILITGGTGFVGTYLRDFLRASEPDARLHLTSHAPGESSQNVIIHTLDLNDSQKVNELIEKVRPEKIFHLASLASVADSFAQPVTVLRNNFNLTLNILETVRTIVPQARTLVVSSSDVYDHTDPAAIDERRGLAIGNPYAASKAAQDAMAQAYAKSFGLPIIIVRPFNHIGPGQRPGFVVADFARAIARAEKDESARTIRVGNLAASRDFTDVRDMVAAYALLMNKGKVGEIYNAGSGQAVTIQSILDSLVAQASAPVQVEIDESKFRPVDAPVVVADSNKLRRLGWQPTIPLAQTLTEILDSWRGIIATDSQQKGHHG